MFLKKIFLFNFKHRKGRDCCFLQSYPQCILEKLEYAGIVNCLCFPLHFATADLIKDSVRMNPTFVPVNSHPFGRSKHCYFKKAVNIIH